jgi:hypothetical protein
VCSFSNITSLFMNSNAYPDKVPNKTTVHRLIKFRDTESVCDKCSSSDRTAEIMYVSISSSASAATTAYGCKNSILPLVSSFGA